MYLASSESVQWNPVVSICISVLTNDVEHFYVLLGHGHVLSGHLFIHVLCRFYAEIILFSFMISFACYLAYILDTSPFYDWWFADFFAHSVGFSFTSQRMSSEAQKFDEVQFIIFIVVLVPVYFVTSL